MGEDDKNSGVIGRGRPKKDGEKVKSNVVKIRMSQGDLERLDEVSKWAKMNRSETIRTLIFEAKNYYISDAKK